MGQAFVLDNKPHKVDYTEKFSLHTNGAEIQSPTPLAQQHEEKILCPQCGSVLVEWMAPLYINPDDNEVRSLAQGAVRALRQPELIKHY